MNAQDITKALGGRWHGSYGTARCPAHEDKNPSLSVSERDGKVLVKCHGPCDQEAVIDALRGRGLWAESTERHVRTTNRMPPRSDPEPNPNGDAAVAIWKKARPAEGTPVQIYLASRCITVETPPSIRYYPDLKHGPTGLELPTMVAAVQGPDRTITGILRTFLAAGGSKKAAVPQNKMMLGRCAGGGVRLAAAADRVAVAEGLETALSVLQATNIPTWATLSTSGMRSLILPSNVREIIICADGDDPGEAAARDVAKRWVGEGRRVRIARPPRGCDFNDVLMGRTPGIEEDAA